MVAPVAAAPPAPPAPAEPRRRPRPSRRPPAPAPPEPIAPPAPGPLPIVPPPAPPAPVPAPPAPLPLPPATVRAGAAARARPSLGRRLLRTPRQDHGCGEQREHGERRLPGFPRHTTLLLLVGLRRGLIVGAATMGLVASPRSRVRAARCRRPASCRAEFGPRGTTRTRCDDRSGPRTPTRCSRCPGSARGRSSRRAGSPRGRSRRPSGA